MRRYPLPAADIIGHTDSIGSAADNQALSESRAQTVMTYLVELGVEPDRLQAIGRGEAEPVAENDTDGGSSREPPGRLRHQAAGILTEVAPHARLLRSRGAAGGRRVRARPGRRPPGLDLDPLRRGRVTPSGSPTDEHGASPVAGQAGPTDIDGLAPSRTVVPGHRRGGLDRCSSVRKPMAAGRIRRRVRTETRGGGAGRSSPAADKVGACHVR